MTKITVSSLGSPVQGLVLGRPRGHFYALCNQNKEPLQSTLSRLCQKGTVLKTRLVAEEKNTFTAKLLTFLCITIKTPEKTAERRSFTASMPAPYCKDPFQSSHVQLDVKKVKTTIEATSLPKSPLGTGGFYYAMR
jgi:hypothetical protein